MVFLLVRHSLLYNTELADVEVFQISLGTSNLLFLLNIYYSLPHLFGKLYCYCDNHKHTVRGEKKKKLNVLMNKFSSLLIITYTF